MANFFKNIFVSNQKLSVAEIILKRTIVSFFFFFFFGAIAFCGWKWLRKQPASADGTRKPLRAILNANESVFKGLLSSAHMAKEYPRSLAANPARVNGNRGMSPQFDPSTWKLNVVKANGDSLQLNLDDIKKLPKTEIIFNFKCIEGWSQITYWGGVRFSEFAKAYGLTEEEQKNYLGLVTPDNGYYVGIDMASALHPQTILAYELNGQPLPMDQGYPLRLVIPVKYGIKSLKRIGTMFFSDQRPRDYWYERGYDYFSGL